MNFLIFDCETTGLPLDWKAPMSKLDNWPRVIQLAWALCDMDGNVHHTYSSLIKPDGWEMPKLEFWQKHGYTQEKSMALGLDISLVLDMFINDLNQSEGLVSHNMSFDYNVVGAEMIRFSKKGKKVQKFCTKDLSTDYCQIPGRYGFKWPKLEELHNILFEKGFDGAHDALADVLACKDCFFELINRNIIQIPIINEQLPSKQ